MENIIYGGNSLLSSGSGSGSGSGEWSSYAVTISSGEITVTEPGLYAVSVESGLSDELNTINGGSNNDEIILYAADTSKTVIVKNGVGNIYIGGDFSLNNSKDILRLIKITDWVGGGLANNV